MNRLMKDRMVYSKIKSTNAFKELEKEVTKSKKDDDAKSLSTIEKKINEKYRKDKSLSKTVAVRGDDLIGAMRVLKKRMQNE